MLKSLKRGLARLKLVGASIGVAAIAVGAGASPSMAALKVPGDPAAVATLGTATAGSETGIYGFHAVAEAAGGVGIAVTLTAVAAMVVMSFIGLARGRR